MPASVSSLSASARHCPAGAARQPVAGVPRQVMFLDGVGDWRGLAVRQRVVMAHRALQLRELPDEVGQQVGLGQQRGALDRAAGSRRGAAARRLPIAGHASGLVSAGCRGRAGRRHRPSAARELPAAGADPAPRKTRHRPGAASPRVRCRAHLLADRGSRDC